MKRKTLAKVTVVVVCVLVLVSLISYDVSIKTNNIALSKPSFLNSGRSNTSNVETGQFNLSVLGGSSEYSYYNAVPFLLQYTVNLSFENADYGLADLSLYMINESVAWPFSGNGFTLTHLSFSSPQGFSAKVVFATTDWKNYTYVTVNTDSGEIYSALINHLGFHNFYLNFTITSYAFLGPLKFKGNSDMISIEWNATIIV